VFSAKDKVDLSVLRKQLDSAKKVIQAQDKHLTSLKHRLAVDAKPKKDRVLRPVHPSFALEIAYRRKLECLIEEMHNSVKYWISAAFKANEPELTTLAQDSMVDFASGGGEVSGAHARYGHAAALSQPIAGLSLDLGSRAGIVPGPLATDALPARELRRAVRKLSRRWLRRFNEASLELAQWFSLRAHKRSTQQLGLILKKGGWSVDLKMTPAQRDILAATIQENVSLIKSIPSQYFTQIEGMVMRSVTTGRDLQQLTNDLQRQFRVTRRRAELISRDQNNKATSVIVGARQIELGLRAVWVHSGAGKHPRPTHVKAGRDRVEYDPREGWWDPAVRRRIWPGTEVNCRCFSRSLVPGFS
jgi:hypothetical protein